MPADHLITEAGLHQLAVPVDGVERDLDKLDLRMIRQHAVQQLGGGMEGDAQVADLSVFLPLFRVIEQVRRLHDAALAVITVVVDVLNVVEQIVIDIVHAQIVQLTPEGLFDLLFRDQHKGRELCRDRKALPRMPLHQRLPGRFLAFAVVIDKACVKVGVPGVQKCVHHPVELRVIEIGGPGEYRKPHHAKAQVLHVDLLL